MWSRSSRRLQLELRLQHDVTATLTRRDERRTKLTEQLPWIISLLVNTHFGSIELRSRILLTTTGLCQLDWHRHPP